MATRSNSGTIRNGAWNSPARRADSGSDSDDTTKEGCVMVERVQLVTDEMRAEVAFQAAGREIDGAIARGSYTTAVRKLKKLMDQLLEFPTEQTLEQFVEMRERWGRLLDVFSYLEAHWYQWVRVDQRNDLIRHK